MFHGFVLSSSYSLAAGLDPPSKKDALLLSTNTEVSIAPKLHSNRQISSPRNSLADGHTPPVKSLAANGVSTIPSKDDCILRVLPARLLPDIRFPQYSGSDLVAYVSHLTFAQLCASKSAAAHSFYCGQFRTLVPPADPTTTPPPPLPSPVPVPASLSGLGGPEGSNLASSKSGKVWIGTTESIPAGHITFIVFPERVDEWALVRYAISRI